MMQLYYLIAVKVGQKVNFNKSAGLLKAEVFVAAPLGPPGRGRCLCGLSLSGTADPSAVEP